MLDHGGKKFEVREDLLVNGKIPLTFWTVKPNMGDLLSPYLVEKLTGKEVEAVELKTRSNKRVLKRFFNLEKFSYLVVGSIIRRMNTKSVVWGSGAFGVEGKNDFNKKADIRAVRGPLTRNMLRIHGLKVPEVYGDPALLMPLVYKPRIEKKYKIGVILRWSEYDWHKVNFGPDVLMINMSETNIEHAVDQMLQCENILSSSLHGIILADTYGIPSAWLNSTTPLGLEFKFYDYFLSVGKVQKPQELDFSIDHLSSDYIFSKINFDSRNIVFNHSKLLGACPFLKEVE